MRTENLTAVLAANLEPVDARRTTWRYTPGMTAGALAALIQACEELGVEHEARTGHKAVQHVKIRRCGTTMMLGTGQKLLKRSPVE
jgi:hypothetical protein